MKLAVFHSLFNVVGVVVCLPGIGWMVRSLERWIRAPSRDLAQPQYLHAATFEYPETAVEAVAREAEHLYDNAFEVMAHGLSLHRADIRSETPIEDVVEKSRRPMAMDLDAVYETKVKVLYASILDYISRAQAQLPLSYAERLFELRRACGLIVESVKEVKHLRKNVTGFMVSDNADIRREYDWIREQVGELMRIIHEIRSAGDDERDALDLDEATVSFEEEDVRSNGKLDELIRAERITPVMGSSLMNDLGYARRAVWNLADAGKVIFGARDAVEKDVEEMLMVTEDDLVEGAGRSEL